MWVVSPLEGSVVHRNPTAHGWIFFFPCIPFLKIANVESVDSKVNIGLLREKGKESKRDVLFFV